MSADPDLERLAEAVYRAHNPQLQAIERLGTAVAAAFSEAAERDGASQQLALKLADGVAQHRQLQARAAARYDVEGLYNRMMARGGMPSALWCRWPDER